MCNLPILFLHGNGDSAALWHTTLWRFESNRYDSARLFTLDLPYPLARDVDRKAQAARSGSAEYAQALAVKVESILHETGAPKLILVGNSRGGYAIRNYVKFAAGRQTVAKVVLGGVPNHGVWAGPVKLGNEFNGSGSLLQRLNEPDANGLETTAGVDFLTLRSDHFDKYAQPSGEWIEQHNRPTNVDANGPALRGARNVVLPGRDHRELSFHIDAFNAMFDFIAGRAPPYADIVAEAAVMLDGQVSCLLNTSKGDQVSNLALSGARLEIYEVDPQSASRIVQRHAKTVGADGRWGPFHADPSAYYEFVIVANGYAVTHVYRSPFPRSSNIIHLRPTRLARAERHAGSILTMTRPRGYFGVGRDLLSLDGLSPPPGLLAFPALSESRICLPQAALRSVVAQCNGERIAMQSWPAKDNHLVFAEFHY